MKSTSGLSWSGSPNATHWSAHGHGLILKRLYVKRANETENRGALDGIPFGAKDMINAREQSTQHKSPIYARYRPGEDAN